MIIALKIVGSERKVKLTSQNDRESKEIQFCILTQHETMNNLLSYIEPSAIYGELLSVSYQFYQIQSADAVFFLW